MKTTPIYEARIDGDVVSIYRISDEDEVRISSRAILRSAIQFIPRTILVDDRTRQFTDGQCKIFESIYQAERERESRERTQALWDNAVERTQTMLGIEDQRTEATILNFPTRR